MAKTRVRAAGQQADEVHEEPKEAPKDEEASELESAVVKMMRMQYGLLAGGAKGMTEMAKMMETFFDSLAEETDLKRSDDWRGILESAPDAMVTAGRKAMEKGDRAAQEVVDTYRRYSEGRE